MNIYPFGGHFIAIRAQALHLYLIINQLNINRVTLCRQEAFLDRCFPCWFVSS